MQILHSKKDAIETSCELLAVGVFEKDSVERSNLADINKATNGALERALADNSFAAKKGKTVEFFLGLENGPKTVFLVGLGKREEATSEKIRRAYGNVGKIVRGKSLATIAMAAPQCVDTDSAVAFTTAAVEGFALATYRYVRQSRDLDKKRNVDELLVICDDVVKEGVESAAITVRGNLFARDLTTTPALDLYPETLAERAKELSSKSVKVEILTKAKLEKLGMGALLGVGQGSGRPPVMIHLTYDPGNLPNDAKTLAIIGKGITFDAGGLDLKPAAGMRDMKIDMGGSAAVMGIFKSIEDWKPNCRVEGFIPAAENMTGDFAYHPGDVLTTYKGLTVEVDNTDAEGRLAMCDALAYAVDTVKPDAIFDIATLTGACWIALGTHATGMLGTSKELFDILRDVGDETGERVWELPLFEEYTEQISSEIADLKNTGGRPGGASTAAAFLKEFVGDVPWVHLDIAGTASETTTSYTPHKELATGVGVRLMLAFMKKWA